MAVEVLDYRLQQGFNQVFTKLVNNEIVNTPYNKDYKSKFFFLKKRRGIQAIFQDSNYEFLDYIIYENITEFLLSRDKTTGDYVIWKYTGTNWVQDLTITGGGKVDKFIAVLGGGGSILDQGTATGGTATTLTDTTKTWTTNQFAGNIIYLKDGTGAGQVREILSNTNNQITVSGWTAIPDITTQYIIYDKKTYNIFVPYNNGIYVYDGNSWYDAPVFSGFNIDDVYLWNARFWFAANGYVFYSDQGDYFFSPAGNELILSDIEVNNLLGFGDYLFVSTPNTIGAIYKGFSTTDGTEFFVLKEGISQIGVKNKGGINIYKGAVYFVSSDGRLYSIQAQVMGNEVLFNLQDNGDLPASFIRQYINEDIKIFSDVNFLYLYTTTGDKSYEIYYDSFYQGWLNNEYVVLIKNKKLLKSEEYVCGDGYFGKRGGLDDIGQSYGQIIRAVVGENDIWQWKFIRFINILLGKSDYIQNGKLIIRNNIDNRKIVKEFDISNAGYLTDIADSISGPLGSSILGYQVLGGENTLTQVIADVEIIQKLLNTAGHIIEIELNTYDSQNGLFFGGFQIYYDKVHPKIKAFNNII